MAHTLMKPINISILNPSAVFKDFKSNNLFNYTIQMYKASQTLLRLR